ncbi:MAG: hypothetical protein Q9163_002979 [Psora crenata]
MPHAPAQERSFRIPSPPRIIVPSPSLSRNDPSELGIVTDLSQPSSSGFANTEFLQTVTYGNSTRSHSMLNWKYEKRRMAQQVLPFLYLGPCSTARDRTFLLNEGISLVLAVRDKLSANASLMGSKVAQELGIEVQTIDVAGNQELIAAFPRGIEIVNAHLSRTYREQQHQEQQRQQQQQQQQQKEQAPLVALAAGIADGDDGHASQARFGKVLVFCESGNDRSASLVVAYIMAMYSLDVVTAIQFVHAQRFAITLDDSLRNLLLTYESILQARRDVIQADSGQQKQQRPQQQHQKQQKQQKHVTQGQGGPIGRSHHTKRSLDDASNEDEPMDIDDGTGLIDNGAFGKRQGRAPFQDRPF